MTTYTNISKPTTIYQGVNPTSKTQFDQTDISYDLSTMYYDGYNPGLYNSITKPTGTTYTNITKPA